MRPGHELLNAAGIPTFDAPEDAIRAFLHMVQYRRNQELLYETPEALPDDWSPRRGRRRAAIFGAARAAGRTLLTEAEAKEVLAAYGLPVDAGRRLPHGRRSSGGGPTHWLSRGPQAAVLDRSRTRAMSAACN